VLGLKVIACASSDEKLEFAKKHGADLTINYAKEDLKDALKKSAARRASTSCSIRSAVHMPRSACARSDGSAASW
jgi:D-arabinose 1-dehydrogenase-like Zn-dependent alcohol dehydrogenase